MSRERELFREPEKLETFDRKPRRVLSISTFVVEETPLHNVVIQAKKSRKENVDKNKLERVHGSPPFSRIQTLFRSISQKRKR